MDNFEWERGYDQRFGLTWVDYDAQERRPKDSARMYRNIAGANAIPEVFSPPPSGHPGNKVNATTRASVQHVVFMTTPI